MRKLIQMFKNLPPEMRMMIAMAGLGTPLGAIYLLQRFVFPKTPMIYIILGVAVVVGVLCLLGFIIARLFGRGKRKREKRMAADLADESAAGPVGMDVTAAIRANNEKYFSVIRDMRKNIGVSIYDLPWYIVIGDSGCGKTKLINEGGLQFPTGKPEGYQLGTLNYNWWFTEDAVFIDMAGRLCNPQVDEDRREWEAFLGTIARGRKGYPINGALVCVSADHLLQDPPEKIEQEANTTLERLRDLQTRLGVTFATYLVVTKCDKIVGFMQFFDRAERDITVLNQMVGWSKPGEFTEPNDPDRFAEEFDALYRRLNELRLRRLNDDVDEIDLGLAYSLPEEFRELRDPLQTYVRTLFPLIKNPRAIKNLIFRGVYFTSATREGSLILKHITERLGPEVAEQFAPLDLYPSKRPYFIKDLLFRKVFPEHGLVFRNEQQAVRNRKLARLLKYGSVALAVVLFAMLGWSSSKFGYIIDEPRAHAQETNAAKPPPAAQALHKTGVLEGDISKLRHNRFWAGILSLGWGTSQPVQDLGSIQAALFERVVLRQALIDVSEALRSTELPDPGDGEDAQKPGREYMNALKEYVTWFGCLDAPSPPNYLSYTSLETLCKIVKEGDSLLVARREAFFVQAKSYFAYIRERGDWNNPAQMLKDQGIDPVETISSAMGNVKSYLRAYAELSPNHPDRVVREWMRIRAACEGVDESYGSILEAGREDLDTLEELNGFKARFIGSYDTFARSLDGCLWQDSLIGVQELRPAILKQRGHWLQYESELTNAYSLCQMPPNDSVTDAIASLSRGYPAAHVRGLDELLWNSIKSVGLTQRDYSQGIFESDSFEQYVDEVIEPYGHIIKLVSGGETGSDDLELADAAGIVNDALSRIERRLRDADLEPSDDPGVPADWIAELDHALDQAEEERPEGATAGLSLASLPDVWQPRDLQELYDIHEDLIVRGQGRALLETIYNALDDPGEWGLAHLFRDAFDLGGSEYYISLPASVDETTTLRATPRRPREDEQPRSKRTRPSRRRGRSKDRERTMGRTSTVSIEGEGQVPQCLRRQFLSERAEECRLLLWNLEDFDTSLFLRSVKDPDDLNRLCADRLKDAAEAYMRAYVGGWSEAYHQKDLRAIERLSGLVDDWTTLAENLGHRASDQGRRYEEVSGELQRSLAEILEAVPFWGWWSDQGEWASEKEFDDPKWQQVVKWMRSAIKTEWDPSLGRFAGQATRPASDQFQRAKRRDAPWIALADEFALRWEKLAGKIADNAELPRKFTRKPSRKDLEKRNIPWGTINALRQDARLEDEKLTAKLVEFEHEAQQLLSVELSNILWNIQEKHFRGEEPYEGWPYLDDGRGSEAAALKTVNFEQFMQFLKEVRLAKAHFEPLEKELPKSDNLLNARLAFFHSCDDWYEFLGLTEKLVPKELMVEVDGADPMSVRTEKVQVHDTAQHYYYSVELDLGLEVQNQDGKYDEAPLRIATEVEKRARTGPRNARWRWEEDTGERPLMFRLVDGHPTERGDRPYAGLANRLGDASPLAFPAYLHRYGKRSGSGTDWITTHALNVPEGLHAQGQGDLAEEIRKAGRVELGLSFRFKLGRALPAPIAMLERPD